MNNITLIGMAGSGKSTLGKLLAEKLGYEFIDVDEIIESSGRKLQEIIDSDREDEFLRIEEKTILSLSGNKRIFSAGGSCVLSPKAMAHLRKISLVVFVDVPFKIIDKRFKEYDLALRGLVGFKEMTLRTIFDFRKPLYQKFAHLTVKLDSNSVEENLEILLDKVNF